MVWDRDKMHKTSEKDMKKRMDAAVKKHSAEVAALKKEVASLDERKKNIHREVAERFKSGHALLEKRTKSCADLEKALEKRMDNFESQKSEFDAVCATANTDIKDQTKMVESRESSFHAKLQTMGKREAQLRGAKRDLDASMVELKEREEALTWGNKDLEAGKESLKKRQFELKQARAKVDEAWEDIRTSRATTKVEREILESKGLEAEKLSKSARKQEQEAAIAVKKILEERDKNEDISRSIKDQTKANKVFSKQLKDKEKELQNLEKALVRMSERLDRRKDVLDTIKVAK